MDFKEVRAKFPQYNDLSDEQLGQALHKKFYSDVPYEDFAKKVGLTKTQQIGQAGFPSAMGQVVSESSPAGRFLGAVYSSMVDQPALRLKQLATGTTPQLEEEIRASREMAAGSLPGAITGAIAGPVGRVVAPVAGPAVAAMGPLTAIPTSAAIGAGTALATTPTLPGESEAQVAGMGALGGATGEVGARTLARVVQPIVQSQAVKKLVSEGVVPTPGGAAGGVLSRVEQKLSSIPLIGDIINRGRGRAIDEFNASVIKRAGGTGIGREAIVSADDAIDQGYRAVLGRMQVSPDRTFLRAVSRIKADPDIALPLKVQTEFDQIVQQQVWQRFGNQPAIPGELAKRADSTLGALARRYAISMDGDQRALGLALRQLQSEFRGLITRNAPDQETANALKALNQKYANLLRVERAASSTAAENGRFTPQQLQQAVKALDPSKNKAAFAKGHAMMQDISDPARQVLADVVPNSGTADRSLWAMLGLGGFGAANEMMGGPGFLTALAASPLLYSRMGSRYMIGDLLPMQPILAEGIRRSAPLAVQAGVAASKP